MSGVSDEKKSVLRIVYKDLEELLPKRNYIIHGETWEGAFNDKPAQPYRVGISRDDLYYLDEFQHGQLGENVFDVQRVRDATKLCNKIRVALDTLRGK